MRRLILALWLTACVPVEVLHETPVAAIAPAEPVCTPWAPIHAAAPPQIRLTRIEDASGFLEAFNHMDPPSDVAADEIWIAKLKTQEGEIARLWFVSGGCLIGRGAIAWEEAEKMMGQGA